MESEEHTALGTVLKEMAKARETMESQIREQQNNKSSEGTFKRIQDSFDSLWDFKSQTIQVVKGVTNRLNVLQDAGSSLWKFRSQTIQAVNEMIYKVNTQQIAIGQLFHGESVIHNRITNNVNCIVRQAKDNFQNLWNRMNYMNVEMQRMRTNISNIQHQLNHHMEESRNKMIQKVYDTIKHSYEEILCVKKHEEDMAPCVLPMSIGTEENRVRLLVDSGASVCVLKKSKCPQTFLQNLKQIDVKIMGVTDHELHILGVCDVPYILGGINIWHETFIIDDHALPVITDGILSRNFLLKHQLYLRGKNDKILYNKNYYQLETVRGKKGSPAQKNENLSMVQEMKLEKRETEAYEKGAEESIKEGKTEKNDRTKNQSKKFADRQLQNNNNVWKRKQYNTRARTNDVHLTNRTVIPPFNMICTQAEIKHPISGNFFFQPENKTFGNQEVKPCYSLHKLNREEKLVVYLVNAGKIPITITKNTKIGELIEANNENLDEIMKSKDEFDPHEAERHERIASLDIRTSEMINDGEEIAQYRRMKGKTLEELINLNGVPAEIQKPLVNLVTKYKSIFWLPGDKLTCTTKLEAEIDIGDNPPVAKKPYRTPRRLLEPLKMELKELLDHEIIEECQGSPFNSPVLLISSKSEDNTTKYRVVIDLRHINKISTTVYSSFPDVNQSVAKASGKKYYSNFDCLKSFFQIPLKKESRDATAFSTEFGTYRFKRMPMGLKNSGFYFTKLMDKIFVGPVTEHVTVFVDDVICHTGKDPQDHLEKLEQVFKIFQDANLKLRIDKTKFFQTEAKFLGYIVNEKGYKPDDKKIEIIRKYPRPTNVKQIKMAIGLFGFYRRCTPDFAKLALPLTNLTRKDQIFNWTPECESAFNRLKEEVCRKMMLTNPDFNKEFRIYADASDKCIGAALCQPDENGVEQPLCFSSRKLNTEELNYPVWRKEVTALKWAIQQYNQYLSDKPFVAFTDHKALEYVMTCRKLQPVIERYAVFFSEYNFEIRYLPGEQNTVADALSRIICRNGHFEYLEETIPGKYKTYEEFVKESIERQKIAQNQEQVIATVRNEVNDTKKKEIANPEEKEISKNNDEQNHDLLRESHIRDILNEVYKVQSEIYLCAQDIEKASINSKQDKCYLELNEWLIKLMLKINGIKSKGYEEVRKAKKEIVKEIQTLIECLVRKVGEPQNQREIETNEEISTEEEEDMSDTSGSYWVDSEEEWLNEPINRCCVINEEEHEKQFWESKVIAVLQKKLEEKIWTKVDVIDRKDIKAKQQEDPELKEIYDQLKNNDHDNQSEGKEKNYYILDEDDVLYFVDKAKKPKLCIPNNQQKEIIEKYHTNVYIPHCGTQKLYDLMASKIYFPKMKQKIATCVRDCIICAQSKPNCRPIKPPMQKTKICSRPWEVINMDYFGPINQNVNGQDDPRYALILVCRFSRFVEVIPVKDLTSDTLIATFLEIIIPQYGLPEKIICDGGSSFISEAFSEFCDEVYVEKQKSTPYYAPGNGLAELTVRETKQYLRNLILEYPLVKWYKFIPFVKTALRGLKHGATKYTPFEIMYNRSMNLPIERQLSFKKYLDTEERANFDKQLWNVTWKEVKNNLEKHQEQTKKKLDKKAKLPELQIGQKVFVKKENLSHKESKIFTPRFKGPYEIVKLTGVNALIKDLSNPSEPIKVHISKLKPIKVKFEDKNEGESDDEIVDETKIEKESENETKEDPKQRKQKKPDEKILPKHRYDLRPRNCSVEMKSPMERLFEYLSE